MKYKLWLNKDAAQDIEETTDYYENLQKGLGLAFLDDFEHISTLLTTNPFMYMRVFWHFRRALMSRFPYAIYYSINQQAQEIEVVALTNQKQDPDIIRKKLRL